MYGDEILLGNREHDSVDRGLVFRRTRGPHGQMPSL